MKKISVLILTLLIVIWGGKASFGATDSLSNGIHFENGLSWKQIVAKAKFENKHIFVDCYATWCVPCKKMDKETYPAKEAGDYFNTRFISVKMQMDTAANDDAQTRAFYADARDIRTAYKISFYPTLLFFNSDGKLLSKGIGLMDTAELIKYAGDAISPQKDYYNLLNAYNEGRRDLDQMAYLARTADELLEDHVQAKTIAAEYMRLLKKQSRFTKENIEFFRQFTSKSNEFGFGFFFKNVAKINEVMKDEDYSQSAVQYILYKEYVAPEINEGKSPDWKIVFSKIAAKYGSYYAGRVTIGARTDWAAKIKNWPEHTKYLIDFIEKYGPKTVEGGKFEALAFNNWAWDIFVHSNDIAELNVALKWSLRAVTIDPEPNWIDTYANILYKLQKNELALKWEQIATVMANHNNKGIEATLTKMKGGQPTWNAN
ncbi:MAG: thioredoxin family protein [Bacteroidetes bacterium]|nr:thioredoxin family protein [Bacteroidota bacterium]